MTKVEGEPHAYLWLCFPGWEKQYGLSPVLPSQLAGLVAWQSSASIAEAFMEQEQGFNWVIYSRAFKLEDYLFWSLKCLEKSLSY